MMFPANWWRIFVVSAVVFSTFSARLTTDTNALAAVVSENPEEKSFSESDTDYLTEIFCAASTPLDSSVSVAATRLVADSVDDRAQVSTDVISARGPPRP